MKQQQESNGIKLRRKQTESIVIERRDEETDFEMCCIKFKAKKKGLSKREFMLRVKVSANIKRRF